MRQYEYFYNKSYLFYLSLIIVLLLPSCDIINPEETTPVFLQIDNFELITDEATQGSSTHQISDIWAFAGGTSIGTFELPATIPVLVEEMETVTLFAGVRDNGIRSTPVIYPFYDRFEMTVNPPEEGQTIRVSPVITYISNGIFELIEDFEDNNLELVGLNAMVLEITTDTDKVREGSGSGLIQLNQESEEIRSFVTFLDLPTSGGIPVYLEMDYRTDVELEIGLTGSMLNDANAMPVTGYLVTLCPIEQWNKVYINLEAALQLSEFEAYQLAFRVSINDTGCENINTNNPEILLDNIKLIRLQP